MKVCPDCGGREVQQRFTGFGGVTGLVRAAASTRALQAEQQLLAALRLQLSALTMGPVRPHCMR